jgi:hypothetical protein
VNDLAKKDTGKVPKAPAAIDIDQFQYEVATEIGLDPNKQRRRSPAVPGQTAPRPREEQGDKRKGKS